MRAIGRLTLSASVTHLSAARSITIEGFPQDVALATARELLLPFLRSTGGDVVISWIDETWDGFDLIPPRLADTLVGS